METLTRTQQPGRSVTAGAKQRTVLPSVNISATGDEYLLEVEMAGVNKEGAQILIDGNELTIIGRRQPEPIDGEVVYRESSTADYRRVFELTSDIDVNKIHGEMRQGVLNLHLPKAERVKPRQI